MFFCLKLFLAHLIADFVLQFEELYQLKVKHHVGQVIHAVIHGATALVLVLPYLYDPFVWGYVTFLTFIHYLQDTVKYRLQKNPKIMFLCFTIDQIMHFMVISSVLLLPVSKLELGFPNHMYLNYFYTDEKWTFYLMALIATTWGTSYFLHALRISYFPNTRPDHHITRFEMSHAILERSFVTGVFIFAPHPAWYAAAPLIGVLRFFSPRIKNKTDFLLSFSCAAVIGLCFSQWV